MLMTKTFKDETDEDRFWRMWGDRTARRQSEWYNRSHDQALMTIQNKRGEKSLP